MEALKTKPRKGPCVWVIGGRVVIGDGLIRGSVPTDKCELLWEAGSTKPSSQRFTARENLTRNSFKTICGKTGELIRQYVPEANL